MSVLPIRAIYVSFGFCLRNGHSFVVRGPEGAYIVAHLLARAEAPLRALAGRPRPEVGVDELPLPSPWPNKKARTRGPSSRATWQTSPHISRLSGAACNRSGWLAVVDDVAGDSRVRERHRSTGVEDSSAVGGMVSGHLAVTQRDGSADQGHRARERHAVGDPAPVPAGTVVVHPAVVECQGDGARPGRALSVEN